VTSDSTTDEYEIDSDLARMDLDRLHRWLSTDAYWALGRTREAFETAAQHSLNFGMFTRDGSQVAYARVVTDHATFAWLCDVYVDPAERGRGLGTWLATGTKAHLLETGVRRVLLATWDAHGVYATAGYTPLASPEWWMELDLRQ